MQLLRSSGNLIFLCVLFPLYVLTGHRTGPRVKRVVSIHSVGVGGPSANEVSEN